MNNEQSNRTFYFLPEYVCFKCDASFMAKSLLLDHIRKTHPIYKIDKKEEFPRLYECFDCKCIFGRYMELHWHMNEHIDWLEEIDSIDMGKLFVCTICNEAYEEKCLLMHHAGQ